MIKKLIVKKLNKKYDFEFNFHPDLNIFTGKNGSGKTTILKLIWYLASGNLDQLFREVYFDYVYLQSDTMEAEFKIEHKKSEDSINGFFNILNYKHDFMSTPKEETKIKFKIIDKSLFLPTFRRIEGGFSINTNKNEVMDWAEADDNLNFEINQLAKRLTPNINNRFITAVSTNDIIELLAKKYTEISEQISKLENEQSSKILKNIEIKKNDITVVEQIEKLVKETDKKKKELLKPITILSDLIKKLFMDKGIEITTGLTLGETNEAIASDKLSSGEKQMLSFLCYNLFSDNTAIFIDEPELSLHADWQRILFPTLLEQGSDNQFFVATHSPFIYSKFPDKEHILDQDRGGSL